MNTDMKIRLFGVALGTAVFAWMLWMDWKFALAVFLFLFADNLANGGRA